MSTVPDWDAIYGRGRQLNQYPWDVVVTFVLGHAPPDAPRREVRVLELGFGAGANLWFAAREGFSVAGVEASPEAVAHARGRFEQEGLEGDLRAGSFTELPFADEEFDLAIDRASLTCVGTEDARRAVDEVRRVLRPGGRLLFNPYEAGHTSASSGVRGADGRVHEIAAGTLTEAGPIRFYDRSEIERLFAEGWTLISLERLRIVDELDPAGAAHTEWRAVLERSG